MGADGGLKLYRSRDGMVVQARSEAGDRVSFWEQGGHYEMCISRASFESCFDVHMPNEELEAAVFRGSWLSCSEGFKGYCSEVRWNGWAMPHFELDEGLRLMSLMEGQIVFDARGDKFIDMPGGLDEQRVYPARSWTVKGRDVKLYGIGAGMWCWDRIG